MKPIVNVLTVATVLATLLCACGKHRVSNKKFYWQADMNGERVTLKDKRNGYEAGVGQAASFAPGNIATRQESNLLPSINATDKPDVFWSLGAHLITDSLTSDEILDMYQPGSYGYYDGKGELYNATAAIVWIDANGSEWNTYNSSGDQSVSSFQVMDVEEANGEVYVAMCQIEFSCTLYNSAGESMQLTNGRARGPVGISE